MSLVAIVFSAAAVAAEPLLPSSSGADVDRLAAATSDGFDDAVRVGRATQTATPPPPPTDPAVQAVLDLTNAERSLRGFPQLQLSPMLVEAAASHAADQFDVGCPNLSHTGTDGSSPFVRIDRAGFEYSSAAENIACGFATPADAVRAWMTSSGHRTNLLNSTFTHIGISATRNAHGDTYWVQVFATPR